MGNDMLILVLGLLVFFAVHSVRMVAGGFRDAQVAVSERRWKGVFSLVSLLGLVLIVWGWIMFRAEAPQVYAPPEWGRHAAPAFVLVAFILLPAAYAPTGYLKRWVRHPMLAAVILWSIGHLLANGDLASVLLFGSFLIYAVVNLVAVSARGDIRPATLSLRGDIIAVAIGVVAFLTFGLWLHGWLFGVRPFP